MIKEILDLDVGALIEKGYYVTHNAISRTLAFRRSQRILTRIPYSATRQEILAIPSIVGIGSFLRGKGYKFQVIQVERNRDGHFGYIEHNRERLGDGWGYMTLADAEKEILSFERRHPVDGGFAAYSTYREHLVGLPGIIKGLTGKTIAPLRHPLRWVRATPKAAGVAKLAR